MSRARGMAGATPARNSPRRASPCVLRARKTRFIELLHKTPPRTVCPNFFVLAHANGCLFQPRCKYCYLKSSLWHQQGQHAFVNIAEMKDEIRKWLAQDNLETYILNAGNLSDSLCFEASRPLVGELVEFFRAEAEARGRPHTLLLVTKAGCKECATLFERPPCRNVIVSFSVNSTRAAADYEPGAAPAADRLRAASALRKAGWRVRIRIDPMIAGYSYTGILRDVRRLRPERVTLGSLRAEANLPRHAERGLFAALEAPADRNGLARYPRALRLEMYGQAIRGLAGVCPIGLCEETPDIWDALGLDKAAKSCNCGE